MEYVYTHVCICIPIYALSEIETLYSQKDHLIIQERRITQAHQKKIRDGDISVVSPGMSLEGWRRQCVRIAESASRKRLGCVLTNATKKGGWGWGEAKSLLPRFLEGFKHQTFWGFTIYIWNKSETTTWDGAEKCWRGISGGMGDLKCTCGRRRLSCASKRSIFPGLENDMFRQKSATSIANFSHKILGLLFFFEWGGSHAWQAPPKKSKSRCGAVKIVWR